MGRKKEKRPVGFSVNNKTEPDLANWLDGQGNITQSLKFLIRLAIKKFGNQDLVTLGLLHSTLTIGDTKDDKSKSDQSTSHKDDNADLKTENDQDSTSQIKNKKKTTRSDEISDTDKQPVSTEKKQIKNSKSDNSSSTAKKDPFKSLGV